MWRDLRKGGKHLEGHSGRTSDVRQDALFPLEITAAYELEELERKQAAEVAEAVFDESHPIRSHAIRVGLA